VAPTVKKLILRSFQCPGDVLMLTAAVRDLHRAHPGRFQTDVRTSADALWENNPYLARLREGEAGVELLDMHYPLVHQSSQRPYHFIHGYIQYLEQQLHLAIPVTRFQGDVHLAEHEKLLPAPLADHGLVTGFWIVVAGGKYDFTAKWWNPASYQQVVDHFKGKIQFAQCGEAGHWHPPLDGVVNLVGKTTTRDFVRLMYHAAGVLCPVTFAMHLAAAVPVPPGMPRGRPCVVVAGGRESPHWEAYPQHQFLHTIGALPCCAEGGCWKSRCQLAGDGDGKDRSNLCEQPVQITPELRIPRCMDMITPHDVIRRIELYLESRSSAPREGEAPAEPHEPCPPRSRREPSHNGSPRRLPVETAPVKDTLRPAVAEAPPRTTTALLKFRHGLGDAVQLTTVLQHLRHCRPDWTIDVAALIGKHSAFHGLCRQVYILDREQPKGPYDRVMDLEWHECQSCFADSPSTKAERCLRETFRINPLPELCTYQIQRGEKAVQRAREYLERVCGGRLSSDARFPGVLIHYEGNTSGELKNIPVGIIRQLCDKVLAAGYVPIILDWDFRTPLADGKRIHNPNTRHELWGWTGTGDAETLAALIAQCALIIGVDSGPLHVAAATDTPTIGVWTGHHPLHYFQHADNVTHLVPDNHAQLLRGGRDAGVKYFREHYRFQTYEDLGPAIISTVVERLKGLDDTLCFTRHFWIRNNNAEQDLVVVQDVAEQDSYRVDELPMPRPVVIDVGAHIGCFARKLHERDPLARIIAVECCPENVAALQKNAGVFATIVQAAVTYEPDVALMNAVYPHCVTTGGSTIVPRQELQQKLATGSLRAAANAVADAGYWADLRPMKTVTLEQLAAEHGFDKIDILKLDCEGSEFSILENATMLDRIRVIVGEYHDKARFDKLVAKRFAGWDLRIIHDGEPGTFWLLNPRYRP
jgi:FkbM family methyltransferase